jgi:hypothetical protein
MIQQKLKLQTRLIPGLLQVLRSGFRWNARASTTPITWEHARKLGSSEALGNDRAIVASGLTSERSPPERCHRMVLDSALRGITLMRAHRLIPMAVAGGMIVSSAIALAQGEGGPEYNGGGNVPHNVPTANAQVTSTATPPSGSISDNNRIGALPSSNRSESGEAGRIQRPEGNRN